MLSEGSVADAGGRWEEAAKRAWRESVCELSDKMLTSGLQTEMLVQRLRIVQIHD